MGSSLKYAMDEQRIRYAFVAYEHQSILGWCGLYRSPDYQMFPDPALYLGVFVAPQYRHRGIGRELKRRAFVYCERKGRPFVWFEFQPDNYWGDRWIPVYGRSSVL